MSIKGFLVNGKVEKYDYTSLVYGGDGVDMTDIPGYVATEAVRVVNRVRDKQTPNTITFMTLTDSHQYDENQNVVDGNLHAGQAARIMSYFLDMDFGAYLGDYTMGSSTTGIIEGMNHFTEINNNIEEAFSRVVNFRTVGNHDPLGYSYAQNETALTPAQLYSYIGRYNDDGTTVMGSTTAGYCYRDYANKKVRVICLNTADLPSYTSGAENVSDAQKKWFADTLIGTPSDYGIIILSHHPLDWGNIMPVSDILKAFVEGETKTIAGTSYNFAGQNKASWILQFHGHTHCYTVDKLHYNSGGTGVEYDVKRIASPNTCFNRNNEYGRNTGVEYYGIEFGESITYNKTAGTARDTAFCVYVIDPDDLIVYSYVYGAGYNRVINFDPQSSTTYYSITANVTNATYTGEASAAAGSAYTATVAIDQGYYLDSISVVMGGADITEDVYLNGTISIPSVDANVVITVEALEDIPATNIVPTLLKPDDYTAVFNGTGYKDNSYASGGAEGNATGYVATGVYQLGSNPENINAIYIRGADITSDDHCRFYIFRDGTTSSSWSAKGSDANSWMTGVGWITSIEQLGTKYWKLTVDPAWATSYMKSTLRVIRMSVQGTGSELFISINNRIADDVYNAFIGD